MLMVSNQGSALEEQIIGMREQGAGKNSEISSFYEQANEGLKSREETEVAVQLNSERLKFIDEFSRLILELKNQIPELAQNLSKTRDYISANQENIPIKSLMNLFSAIQQNLEVLENKSVPAQRLELIETIKNLVQEAIRILQPNSEIPTENKLILALSKNDFISANTAIKNIVEQATQQIQQTMRVQNPKTENFQVILNSLQELKELGIPKELQKAPLKELEAIALQKNGIEIPKESAKNLSVIFSEKPIFATINLKIDSANTVNPRLEIIPLPSQEQPQEQKQSQRITHAFEITLPKDFPLQKILANIPLLSAQNYSQPLSQHLSQKIELAFSFYQVIPVPVSSEPSQTQMQAQPQVQVQTQPQMQVQTQPQAQVQMQPQAQPQAQVQTQPQAQVQTQPQAQVQTQPQAQVQTQLQAQVQAQPQASVQPKPQAQVQTQTQANEAKFILQPWAASIAIPKEERNFWLKTNLPLTPQILNIRDAILSFGKLPENPEIARLFASGMHELSLLTEHGASISKEQTNLLWRVTQTTANEPWLKEKQMPMQIIQTLLKYQPHENYEGDLFKKLPEPVKRELMQEIPSGKAWQPETLQKAIEKVLEKYIELPAVNSNDNKSKTHEEIRSTLQNLKEQIQWTRIDQETKPQNDKENVFYFMHNNELQKGRLKVKDERKGNSKKQQDSISFTIKTKTKNLGETHADLTLCKGTLNIRLQDEIGTANNAVKEERETLAKELSDIGIALGELLYGKTPKIQNLPLVKKERVNSGFDVRA
jgi:hypothetical protein